MRVILMCSVVLLFTETAGVSHWKLQDGVIKAVVGNTVITGTESNEINKDQIIVEDKELYILMRQIKRRAPISMTTSTPIVADTSSNNNKKPRLKITKHKPSMGTCRIKKKDDHKDSSVCIGPDTVNTAGMTQESIKSLTCGEPVEFTAYDFLMGVARRKELPMYSEPEVAMIFKSSPEDTTIDLIKVESALQKALYKVPVSVDVYNQIGNIWRIKGHTLNAIECFRRGLALSPNDPDILLNLAHVLFNHKYINNTIYLAKLSIHHKYPKTSTWLQHYLLGEAHKLRQDYVEASYYFKKALEFNPTLHIAEIHLRELGQLTGEQSTNWYTILIIITLVTVVLTMVYYLVCYY